LVEQLCQALGAAHDAGFVHRDLKPDNLWLLRKPDHTPFLKILDFGIAKNIRIPAPGLTVTGQVLGTAQYMAPEQVLARTVDTRTDIYAIGIILYRIPAGELPFDDPNLYTVVTKQVTEEPRPLSAHRKLPTDLERVVMRCLAKEPADRPQTDAELWREIGPALRAWQSAKTNEGLGATRWAPVQASTLADLASRESPIDHEAKSQSTIQPVGRTYQKTRTVSRNGKRVLGACIVVTMAMAGGSFFTLPFLERARRRPGYRPPSGLPRTTAHP
jgi:serine/threonine protein kinase